MKDTDVTGWFLVEQDFEGQGLLDLKEPIEAALPPLSAGMEVAVAVGSRGIDRIAEVVALVAEGLRAKGCSPFIVPAMGSHGGADGPGQKRTLEALGIDESIAPMFSEWGTVDLPSQVLPGGIAMAKRAWGSDAIVILNRVKPHTSIQGEHESGLVKMLALGLGQGEGAQRLHALGPKAMSSALGQVAKEILDLKPNIHGMGLVENAQDQLCHIQGCPATSFLRTDAELLVRAKALAPSLPIQVMDLLMVDEMGKNYSGTGMDTNVIGRRRIPGFKEPLIPRIGAITCHGLSEESGGNATGVGLADVITGDLQRRIDWPVTRKNVLTTGFLERGKCPVVATTDREALDMASRSLHGREDLAMARIANTLQLQRVWVNRRALEGLKDPRVVAERDLIFDGEGALLPFEPC